MSEKIIRGSDNVLADLGIEPTKTEAMLIEQIKALVKERDGLEKDLRTVQNAAKTIAAAQGTELEHLRQHRSYDHKLRQEHESLLDRDAQMTDALLAAEAERDTLAKEKTGLMSDLARMDLFFRSIRYHADNGHQDRPVHERLRLISEEANKALDGLLARFTTSAKEPSSEREGE